MPAKKRIRIRLKATDQESLARTFARNLDSESVFLPLTGEFEAGAEVLVDLQYASGESALSGDGRIQSVTPAGTNKPGLFIAIAWNAKSRAIVDAIKTQAKTAERTPTEYARFDKTRETVDTTAVPDALPDALEDPTPLKDEWIVATIPLDDDDGEIAEGWESLSGEVTPLARIDLVQKSDGPFSSDIEDSGGFERKHFRGEPVQSRASKRELPPKSRLAIGIDLGTTHSSAAIIEGGTGRILPTRRGTRTLPSMVTILPGGRTVVGEYAMRQQPIHPTTTIACAKRLIGRPFLSPAVQRVREQYPYDIVEGDEGEAAVRVGEYRISFEEITALILKELREGATANLNEKVNRAVITCPAYYNERQREAVRMAGELAGIHVERLLNEPTAAAINYALANKPAGRKRVLVYDLGGGTFDASLIEIEGDEFSVVATGGDTFLGGLDFDAAIVSRVVEHVRDKHSFDPSSDPTALVRLAHAAEHAKRQLSESDRTTIHIDHFFTQDWEAQPLEVELTRVEAEAMFDPLIERTLLVCQDVLARAKLAPAELDDIILVGGQSRSPIVSRRVREMFEREPKRDVVPDEAVAIGAAHYAQSAGTFEGLHLVNALPVSIGIGLPNARYQKIIERDTRLPATKSHRLATTRDGQSMLEVVVFQGEDSDLFSNELIGMLRMPDLPLAPAGEIAVTVSFELDGECLLKLSAKEERSGRVVATEFMAHGATADIQRTLDPPTPEPFPAIEPSSDPRALKWLKTRLGRNAG